MRSLLFITSLFFALLAEGKEHPEAWKNIGNYKNIWNKPPAHIPNSYSVDAPLMGNGDMLVCTGFDGKILRYYLSKNDFWRLKSQADGLSGPRLAGFMDITVKGCDSNSFSAQQLLQNGATTCSLKNDNNNVDITSWVAATENILIIEIYAKKRNVEISWNLSAPENSQAQVLKGSGDGSWLTRSFSDDVDVPTSVALAYKAFEGYKNSTILQKGNKVVIAVAMESKFKSNDPLEYVHNHLQTMSPKNLRQLKQQHDNWWKDYWSKSSIVLSDTLLEKAWYQGLYTMAACSRDPKFPPGIFGWTSTDAPAWNGDYHLNYNFQAPFYALYSSNRLEQAETHDAPLIDFMARGEWYAKNVTNTRGILFPVGIGPMGIEVTRNFAVGGYQKKGDIEQEGLFFGQRSNAAYGLLNMAQQWRCTYDINYGKKIYPYALAVVNFWEDYLKFENGRYVIYGDAIHEGSGKDKNPILSLGLVRNAFDLILDLSASLKVDESRRGKWKDIADKLSDFPIQIRNGRKVFRYTEEGIAWWGDNGLGIQHIYPANSITLDSKEELLTIARNTIDEMHRWNDMNTSSSFFVAAIRVGYEPSVVFNELHKYALRTNPNGFQLNNPHGIENSCTVTNAINEMLCMSAGHVIRLFAGFPKDKNAQFNNIRAWGAFLISARMTNGVVSDVKMVSEKGKPCDMMNPWPDKKVLIIRNGKKAETISGNRLSFKTAINETVELKAI